jgi:hypothetical protein
MQTESGEWVMQGLAWDDPKRIKTTDELLDYINRVGFLPLFGNEIPGFSVEDHTSSGGWWSEDPAQDPWLWRQILAHSGEVAYGKFFNRKAGFISKEWFPVFANYRRDGYDFDARCEDELASNRSQKIMKLFETNEELFSFEVKKLAGFGKEGEKNFEGIITELQMQSYLVTRDFQKRRRKKDGQEYGWAIAIYTTPENLWGYDLVSSAYQEDPQVSKDRIYARIKEEYPWASDAQIRRAFS